MKKLSLLGGILFLSGSLATGQTQFGLAIGAGPWWASCNKPIVNSDFSPAYTFGAYALVPVYRGIHLKTGLNYNALMSNYSYKASAFNICWEAEGTNQAGSIGDAESATSYHQLSLPLGMAYPFGRCMPYLGGEYNYRWSESWLNRRIHSFGIKTGIEYQLSGKIAFSLDYYAGCTKDYEYTGHVMDCNTMTVLETNSYFWKSSRLGLHLHYRLNSGKKD